MEKNLKLLVSSVLAVIIFSAFQAVHSMEHDQKYPEDTPQSHERPHSVSVQQSQKRIQQLEHEVATAWKSESPDQKANKRIKSIERQLANSMCRSAGEEGKAPFERPEIPLAAQGYQEVYLKFLNGVLIYRPDPKSDAGMITLPIAKLANPLEGTFDLSQCEKMDLNLSISTGYRKAVNPKNGGKIEIWITPRFLVEQNLGYTRKESARHLQQIFDKWDAGIPVGIFWNDGDWRDFTRYDYLITQPMEKLGSNSLYKKWTAASITPRMSGCEWISLQELAFDLFSKFSISFYGITKTVCHCRECPI